MSKIEDASKVIVIPANFPQQYAFILPTIQEIVIHHNTNKPPHYHEYETRIWTDGVNCSVALYVGAEGYKQCCDYFTSRNDDGSDIAAHQPPALYHLYNSDSVFHFNHNFCFENGTFSMYAALRKLKIERFVTLLDKCTPEGRETLNNSLQKQFNQCTTHSKNTIIQPFLQGFESFKKQLTPQRQNLSHFYYYRHCFITSLAIDHHMIDVIPPDYIEEHVVNDFFCSLGLNAYRLLHFKEGFELLYNCAHNNMSYHPIPMGIDATSVSTYHCSVLSKLQPGLGVSSLLELEVPKESMYSVLSNEKENMGKLYNELAEVLKNQSVYDLKKLLTDNLEKDQCRLTRTFEPIQYPIHALVNRVLFEFIRIDTPEAWDKLCELIRSVCGDWSYVYTLAERVGEFHTEEERAAKRSKVN